MPYLWILLCLLTSVVCIQFGMQVSDPYEYPYYMMLGNPHICGGALLSYDPAYVLTAAHCVADAPSHPSDHDKEDNPYFVGYHDTNRKNQKTMRIADWVIHPSYNISSTVDMNYDVAIVKLESPLKISNRIRRIALWSSNMTSSIPTQGDLVGFGYMDLEKKETQDMQKLKLNITRFMPKEPKMMVEARAEKEEMIACHGDSGSPLIVHKTVTVPDTNEKVAVPFVAGNLARIFGAYDQSPESLTCPLPFVSSHSRNGSTNSVVESFCNTATMLDWISSVVGISTEDLADPFYIPPCRNCRKIYRSGNPHGTFKGDGLSYNDMIYEDDNGWHIGVVTDDEFLQDEGDLDSFWIGPIIDSLRINKTSKGQSIYHHAHLYLYISSAILFISYIILI